VRQRRPYMAAKVRPPAAGAATRCKPVKRSRGRPSAFNAAIADEICNRLANGETLRQICSDPSMPAKATVMRWLAQQQRGEFRDQYARARELLGDSLAEEVIAIADDGAGDVIKGGDGGETVDWENVQRSRLRVDARKWFASKVAPKKYGERVAQELSGPGGAPIAVEQRAGQMVPAEVGAAVRNLFDQAERDLKLSDGKGMTMGQRLKRILGSGGLIPPQLYAALHGEGRSDRDRR
jgi:hypothetical protein